MTSTIEHTNVEVPANLFKLLRQASGLSHDKLAKRMRTTKYALIRLEQGLYERPLPVALEFWLSEEGASLVRHANFRLTELTLTESYEQFQEETRDQNRHYFGPNLSDLRYGASTAHPLTQLKTKARALSNNYTGVGLAKAMCVPQSTISLWETKWRVQQSVPKAIQSALLNMGYTRFEVKALVDGYITWRELNK